MLAFRRQRLFQLRTRTVSRLDRALLRLRAGPGLLAFRLQRLLHLGADARGGFSRALVGLGAQPRRFRFPLAFEFGTRTSNRVLRAALRFLVQSGDGLLGSPLDLVANREHGFLGPALRLFANRGHGFLGATLRFLANDLGFGGERLLDLGYSGLPALGLGVSASLGQRLLVTFLEGVQLRIQLSFKAGTNGINDLFELVGHPRSLSGSPPAESRRENAQVQPRQTLECR